MTPKENRLELAIISIVFILLSLVGAVWTFTSGLLAGGVDGILLLLVCLMIALVFALMLLMFAFEAGWIKRPKPAPKASTAKAAAPGVSQTTPAK
ncbi:MAG: hypothetical protein WA755_04930 [Candidatus Acidiferrales bacterium]